MNPFSADRLLQITIALSAEKDISLLLDRILTAAIDLTRCDAGTIYIREDDHLVFHNMITRSQGVHLIRGRGGDMPPPVPLSHTHVCACSALEKKLINIADVYQDSVYNFAGTRHYDELNDYRTRSMLVVPMEDDRGRCIGVLQLINALDDEGWTVPFAPETESVIRALGSQAAVCLNNTLLQQAVSDILHSFVMTLVDVIDARSPYNANHTRSMVRYAEKFIVWLNNQGLSWQIGEEEKDPLLMSVWLHDVGKLVVPLEIMDKPTRLGTAEAAVRARIREARLAERLRALEHPDRAEDARKQEQALTEAQETLAEANTAPFLSDELLARLEALRPLRCLTADGESVPLLTAEEWTAITVRRGTLTEQERHEIEKHAEYTRRFLDKVHFSGAYASVPAWASAHHETLDGSGYPDRLPAEKLPREVRLLTILDIYDALTAEDRPYKPPLPPEEAFAVLEKMRDSGKLDGGILALFRKSGAWRKN